MKLITAEFYNLLELYYIYNYIVQKSVLLCQIIKYDYMQNLYI